jgi:hypothetical protein
MTRGRLALWVAVALLVALLAGWIWGSAGRRAAERLRDEVTFQLEIARARGHLLEARVAIYNVNFGDAQRHLELAKRPLERAVRTLRDRGRAEAAASVETALRQATEAQQLAGKLDQAANTRAAEALRALEGVGGPPEARNP